MSGLWRFPAKEDRGQPRPGFESRSLRQAVVAKLVKAPR